MKIESHILSKPLRIVLLLATALFCAGSSQAQVQARITANVDNASRFTIAGSRPGAVVAANDIGPMSSSASLEGVTVVFSRSPAQAQALQTLIAAQQNPASPLYHQWLNPDQFAAQFGAADSDIAKVEAWLQAQGLTVQSVSRSRNRITFSGSVGQIQAALGTELHYFRVGSSTHFAPASDISIPAAFASAIQGVTNLNDFRPKPHLLKPALTSSLTGSHFLTPKDVGTIYDINPAYTATYTGAGQSIAVIGQSAIVTTDITAFQTAAGVTVRVPNLVLMPGSGTSTLYSGDESESDLDLEYSGGIATGANLYFVYTGNSPNLGVFDAAVYAIDEKIASIITISYGDCETDLGSAAYATYNNALAQAATQGQTVVTSSGDTGSTGCFGFTNLTQAQATALAVQFPASSQYATGLGGTEFPAADTAIGNTTYWAAQGTTDVISSALSYIPEQAWNDDSSTYGLSSGGGGTSVFTARPTWQTGVTGIPTGSFRLVPDISLASSPNYPGYLYCTSDSTSWNSGQQASCNNGFRDAASTDYTIAGGTSFAAPIFAGMVAIINQARNSTGQGVINSTLYTLAASTPTAFHDTTSGTNACTSGVSYPVDPSSSTLAYACPAASATSFAATTGYDEATGLGSLDFYKLLTAWPKTSASSLVSTTTTVSAASSSPIAGATDTITIAVTAASSTLTTTPTGTVTLTVDGTTLSTPFALTAGVATYTFSSATNGAHVISALYSGDSTYAPSSGAVSISIGTTTSATPAFTLGATSISVSAGSTGTSTVTVTPAGGYTGTVAWYLYSNVSLTNACYKITSLPVTGTVAVSTTLSISTSASACGTAAIVRGPAGSNVLQPILKAGLPPQQAPFRTLPVGLALSGLILVGSFRRRLRKGWSLLALCLVGILSLGISGCGGTSSSTATTTTANAAKGTYTLTLIGTDTNNVATATTNLTLTIN